MPELALCTFDAFHAEGTDFMHMMSMAAICRLMAIMMVAVVLVYSWRCELLP